MEPVAEVAPAPEVAPDVAPGVSPGFAPDGCPVNVPDVAPELAPDPAPALPQAAVAETVVAPEPALKPTWTAFPVAGLDSDDGFGFGARAQLDIHAPGVLPYKQSYVVHLFMTTEGYHHHRFKFDLVNLGKHEKLRLTGHFAFRAWLNDGYWGMGNGSVHDTQYDDLAKDDPRRSYYHYQLIQPFAHLTLRDELATFGDGRLSGYSSLEARYSIIRSYEGSLLEQEQPHGVNGGAAGQITLGLLWDTRSPETTPESGALLEVSGRVVGMASTDPGAGDATQLSAFGGPMLSARGYVPIVPQRLTWATRGMGEWLFGPVPFYEMVHWGGFVPIAGVGGAETLRGASFGRWRGPGKAVFQNELRIDVLTHRALKHEVRWQLVPFADVGSVWGMDLESPALLGDAVIPVSRSPLHPAGGLGVRGIFATTLVGRFDVAVAQDVLPNGVYEPSLGFYLAFDHTY